MYQSRPSPVLVVTGSDRGGPEKEGEEVEGTQRIGRVLYRIYPSQSGVFETPR